MAPRNYKRVEERWQRGARRWWWAPPPSRCQGTPLTTAKSENINTIHDTIQHNTNTTTTHCRGNPPLQNLKISKKSTKIGPTGNSFDQPSVSGQPLTRAYLTFNTIFDQGHAINCKNSTKRESLMRRSFLLAGYYAATSRKRWCSSSWQAGFRIQHQILDSKWKLNFWRIPVCWCWFSTPFAMQQWTLASSKRYG